MTQRVDKEAETGLALAEHSERPQPSGPAPRPAIGSAEWTREIAELDSKREEAKVYQLAFWDDDKRAMPTDFVACALFAALHGKNAQYLRGEYIASINGYTVTYTGKRLTQVHADIVMGALHLMRGRPQGDTVEFRVRPFLRLIGRHTGKTDRDSFRQLIDDVIATAVRITRPDGKLSYAGSILAKAKDVEVDDDTLFVLEVHREIAKLFESGFGTIDWEKRKSLMRQPLCLWLQLYFSKFGTRPVAVAELHRLSGSTAPLKKFRQNLRIALSVLESKSVVAAWIDPATDSVRREHRAAAPPSKPLARPSLPQSSLPHAPSVSAHAKAQFRQLYPEHDAETCARSFTDWLARKGHTAKNPDAAFLGFANKWVKSTPGTSGGEPRHHATYILPSKGGTEAPPLSPGLLRKGGSRGTRQNGHQASHSPRSMATEAGGTEAPDSRDGGNRSTSRGKRSTQPGEPRHFMGEAKHLPGGTEAPHRGKRSTPPGNRGTVCRGNNLFFSIF